MLQGDGSTLREHLSTIWKSYGRKDPRISAECPEGVAHLWEWYVDLRMATPVDRRISYVDLDAWCRIKRIRMTQTELQAINLLDAVRQSLMNKARGNGI